MKYRVNAKYAASITIDVVADSEEEAENKARELFEACDPDDFSIGDEIEIDADQIVEDGCLHLESEQPIQMDERAEPLLMDLTGDIYFHRGNVMVDMGIHALPDRPVDGNNIVQ